LKRGVLIFALSKQMNMRHILTFSSLLIILTFTLSCKHAGNSDADNKGSDPVLLDLNAKIEKEPKNADLYQQRAVYFMQHEKLNDALTDIDKAIEINPKNPAYFLSLSDIYIMMGKPQQGLESIEKAITLNDKNVEAYLRKARLYMIMKDYEHCAESVEKVFSIDPQNADAFYLKGYVLGEYGDTTKAIDAYRKAVQSNQLHYDALMQLGSIFVKKDPVMAIGYFENALKAKPKSMEALYNLAMMYQENDKPDQAIRLYGDMLKIDPKNRFALYNSGYVYLVYLNNYTKAIDYFSRAFQADSTYADALFNRGYAYELSGDFTRARTDYNKVLKISANYPKAIEGLNRLDTHGR